MTGTTESKELTPLRPCESSSELTVRTSLMALIRVWLESVPGFADFAACVHFPAVLSNDHVSQFSVK